MKKQTWIILFIIILTIHLAGIVLNNQWLSYISKPMIVVLIGLYFLAQTDHTSPGFKKWILGALIFSWTGDVLLLLQPENEIFFLLGLCAFLIAHIFYIFFFHHVRIKESVRSNTGLLLIAGVYYFSLIILLFPHLGNMQIAVPVYGLVISFMFLLALHMLFIKNKMAGGWMMIGALLFIISDSLLAINKFYQPFDMAGLAIMATYGMAQLFIVEGAIKYITSRDME